MARVGFNQLDEVAQQGIEYFSLKNDGDRARVRFLLQSPEDLCAAMVHAVKYNGKTRSLDCLCDGDDINACPFCASGKKPILKFFIPILDIDNGNRVVYWERGQNFRRQIQSLLNKYPNLCNEVFEITRYGRKGDTETTYDIVPITDEIVARDKDNPILKFNFSDYVIPAPADINIGLLLQRSYDEAQTYLDKGHFTDDTFDYDTDTKKDSDDTRRGYEQFRRDYSNRDFGRGGSRNRDYGDESRDYGYRERGYSTRTGRDEYERYSSRDDNYDERSDNKRRRREF